MTDARRKVLRGFALSAAAPALMLALVACVGEEPDPAPQPSGTAASSSPTPTPEPSLVPEGTAEENQPYFDEVNRDLLAENPEATGEQIAENLVAAGFDRAAIEATPAQTAIGLEVDQTQVAVALGGDCLIAQTGNVDYVSVVAPVLTTGRCLVGTDYSLE